MQLRRVLAHRPTLAAYAAAQWPTAPAPGVPKTVPAMVPAAQQVRSFHPAVLLGGLALKKWTLYKLGSNYGWPLVYRRLLEQNKLRVAAEHQGKVQQALAKAFRSPAQIFELARDSHVAAFLQQVTGEGAAMLPRPVRSLLDYVVDSTLGSTFGGKVAKDLDKRVTKKQK
jgi:hypothetical protein